MSQDGNEDTNKGWRKRGGGMFLFQSGTLAKTCVCVNTMLLGQLRGGKSAFLMHMVALHLNQRG